jgi:cell wall-associated NlpC family hydrolase
MSAIRRGQRLRALPILLVIVIAVTLLLSSPAEARTKRERKIAHAMHVVVRQKGDPYVYGANGPGAFDCSGLTKFSFHKAGLYLPRSSTGQYHYVRHIKKTHIRRGDLVFFHDRTGHVYHVAVFAGRANGDKLIWHAPYPGKTVSRDRIWTHSWYAGTLRVRR